VASLANSLPKLKIFVVAIITALALIALLVPGSVLPAGSRSLFYLWESGHLFLFFLGSYLFYICFPRIQTYSFRRQSLILLSTTLFFVVLIETLQNYIADKPLAFTDIIGDFAGSLLFMATHSRLSGQRKRLLSMTSFLLAAFVLWPVCRALTDELLARYQFPCLADFETPFEHSRFEGKTGQGRQTSEQAFSGRHSLRLSLWPGFWSGMTLKYFPADWRAYNQLHFAVYNPERHPVSLHFSIHDKWHEQGGQPYSDRFRQVFLLPTGWTRIQIPLVEILAGPQTRSLDLSRVNGLSFFVIKEQQPVTLYLDSIRLE